MPLLALLALTTAAGATPPLAFTSEPVLAALADRELTRIHSE